MAAVNRQISDPHRSAHLAYLLHMATRRLRAEAEAVAAADVAPLRAAQARLLDLIPESGGRVTDLASRVRISKQGLGQLAMQLADRGLVEISPDPADRRAKIIRRTAAGEHATQVLRASIGTVEGRWRGEVGAERYITFLGVLGELVDRAPAAVLDPDEAGPVS